MHIISFSLFVVMIDGSSAFIPYPSLNRNVCGSSLLKASDPSQADLDNHSNQMNPNNDAYWDSRDNDDYDDYELDNHANQMNPNNDAYYNDDNHANQMNPNNDAYWASRGN